MAHEFPDTEPPRDAILYPDDRAGEYRIASEVVDWTFRNGLWDRINEACGTDIDDYEGVTLNSLDVAKASEIIRQTLAHETELSKLISDTLNEVTKMLDACAHRGTAVMFSI